jgi:hypothetical protein
MPEEDIVEAYDASDRHEELAGGKKHRKSSKRTRGRKVHHKRSMKKRSTKKHGHKKHGHKKAPSKWIMHVKAYCKKTGKTFPEALKDPMCRKTFKH